MKLTTRNLLQVIAGFSLMMGPAFGQIPGFGLFSSRCDVGKVDKPGSLSLDPSTGSYRVSGTGENLGLTNDSFQFVWKQLSAGHLTFAADARWLGPTSNPGREACLMIRQTLDPGSPYVGAVLRANGVACLQCRENTNDPTRLILSNIFTPARVRIERHADDVTFSAAGPGEKLRPAGGSFHLHFTLPFYLGLAVCGHGTDSTEAVEFSNVELLIPPPASANRFKVESTLEIIDVSSSDRRVVYQTSDHIEAPNWSRDGSYFLFNSADRIWKIPITGGKPHLVDTGRATHCGSNHGISPDGEWLAMNDYTSDDAKSRIYVLPVTGGQPRLVTPDAPSYSVPESPGVASSPFRRLVIPYSHSYWHGWSPDGKTIAYSAERSGEFDVYTISVQGGGEKRLTTAPGIDDGPDYSSDGRYIFFSSERTGLMQIWRMKTDGSEQTQITADEFNNWLPHPSPKGRWVVFLSYPRDVKGLPENKDVMLRLMDPTGGRVRVLAKLLGGHGTIDVPSWSPDARQLAFVSYQRIYP